MDFFKDVLVPVGIGAAALYGGSYFFPETTAALTGGYFGQAAATGVGPVASGATYGSMLGSGTGAAAGAAASGGLMSFLGSSGGAAAIIAGTSLLSSLFSSDLEEERFDFEKEKYEDATALDREKFELSKEQFEQQLQLEREKIAAQAGAAGAAVSAQQEIARKNRLLQLGGMRADAMGTVSEQRLRNQYKKAEGIERGRAAQAQAAANYGTQSGMFFNNLVTNLQRPLLRSAA